jgi:diguanylate cyclase (GGDEF)-like protein
MSRSLFRVVSIFIYIAFASPGILLADTQDYVQQKWRSSQGLAQDSVQAILQTRDGYLWIATERGLSRFDGIHFETFRHKNTPQLKDDYVGALYESRDGALWIGTGLNGLTRYKDGLFSSFRIAGDDSDGRVSSIQQDLAGDLWIGTTEQGIVRLRQGRTEVFQTPQGLTSKAILSLLVDHEGTLWVGTDGGGLNRWNGNRFVRDQPKGVHIGDQIAALCAGADDSIWVGATNHLFKLRFRNSAEEVLLDRRIASPVLALHLDRTGVLWVGTDGGGLELHNARVISRFNFSTGLPSQVVQTIFEDREGSVWIGTDGGGIDQFRKATFKTYTRADGLPGETVLALASGLHSDLWVGTSAGLSRYRNGVFTKFAFNKANSSQAVRALFVDHRGSVWIGTDGQGLFRLGAGRSRPSSVKLAGSPRVIMALEEDPSNSVWIGMPNGLMQLTNGGSRTFTTRDGLPNNVILSLHVDRRGDLWIGTSHGLAKLANSKFTSYTARDGFTGDAVVSEYEDSTGKLWFGTFDGFFRWNGVAFSKFTTQDGLMSNVVTDISESDSGDLWLRSNTEVSRISKQELNAFAEGKTRLLHPIGYDARDGMGSPVAGGGQPGNAKRDDGSLLFTSALGLMTVEPSQVQPNDLAPPVVISDVIINGRAVDAGSVGAIKPGMSSMEFHFAALSFVEPENQRFKYQLIGLDKDWVDAGTRNSAYYTNISPGAYEFRVIACNRDGIWNSEGARFRIVIPAHFYQTNAFYLGCIVLLGLISAIVYRTRVQQRERHLLLRQQELETIVRQRTEELELEKQQLVLAREALRKQATTDGLTGLSNRTAIMEKLEEEMVRAHRSHQSLSLVMVDVDHFKSINDSFGHQIGDRVLIDVADRLTQSTRTYDSVGRYGGEEFLMVLPDFHATLERDRMEEMRSFICDRHSSSASDLPKVTCSFGVSTMDADNMPTLDEFLARADQALYRAKRSGRNRVECEHGR